MLIVNVQGIIYIDLYAVLLLFHIKVIGLNADHQIAHRSAVAGKVLFILFKQHTAVRNTLFYNIHGRRGNFNDIFHTLLRSFQYLFIKDIMLSVFLIIIPADNHFHIVILMIQSMNTTDGNQYIFCQPV